jgi:hypothetical protein
MSLCFRLIAVEFVRSHKRSMSRNPTNMGIAGVEPRQLALTVGTTGSGSTDSPAPSPTITNLTASTRFDDSISATAVDSASPFDIDTNAKINIDNAIDNAVGIVVPTIINTNAKIDINTAIDTAVGIAVPTIIDTISSETKIDVAKPTVIDTAPPSVAILTPAATIINTTPSSTGPASAKTGGFDMAFGLFSSCVDNDGAMELISISDSAPPAAKTSTPPAVGGNPSTIMPLAPSEEESRLKKLTPAIGSNDFEDSQETSNIYTCGYVIALQHLDSPSDDHSR